MVQRALLTVSLDSFVFITASVRSGESGELSVLAFLYSMVLFLGWAMNKVSSSSVGVTLKLHPGMRGDLRWKLVN